MIIATALWRRLDTPGHDACRIEQSPTGWQLDGSAVFIHNERVARLSYRVSCDIDWRAQRGEVCGWVGADTVELSIARTAAGVWSLNGAETAGLEQCTDLDFGFTPATNLPQLRRLALTPGQAADAPAAWYDLSTHGLVLLPQRYERRDEFTYRYESPTTGYAALLEVDPNGFIQHYPGLWKAENHGDSAADR